MVMLNFRTWIRVSVVVAVWFLGVVNPVQAKSSSGGSSSSSRDDNRPLDIMPWPWSRCPLSLDEINGKWVSVPDQFQAGQQGQSYFIFHIQKKTEEKEPLLVFQVRQFDWMGHLIGAGEVFSPGKQEEFSVKMSPWVQSVHESEQALSDYTIKVAFFTYHKKGSGWKREDCSKNHLLTMVTLLAPSYLDSYGKIVLQRWLLEKQLER